MFRVKKICLIITQTCLLVLMFSLAVMAENENKDTIPPRVVSTSPSDGEINVGIGLSVKITYSKECYTPEAWDLIKPSSEGTVLKGKSIIIEDENGNIISPSGGGSDKIEEVITINTRDVFENGKRVSGGYDGFQPNTKYMVKIPEGHVRDLAGNLSPAYTFSFTTGSEVVGDIEPPNIKASPSDGSVSAGSDITVTVTDASGVGYLSYEWDTGAADTLYFSTQSSESLSKKIKVPNKYGMHALTIRATDGSENENDRWATFNYKITTNNSYKGDVKPPYITKTSPASKAKSIAPDDISLTLTFSENVNFGTNKVIIKDSNGKVVAEQNGASLGDNKMRIYVVRIGTFGSSRLKPNTKYTVIIPKGVALDKAGNQSKPYSFYFTTGKYKNTKLKPLNVSSTTPKRYERVNAEELSNIDEQISISFPRYILQKKFGRIKVKDDLGNIQYGQEKLYSMGLDVMGLNLLPERKYIVTIPAGIVKDEEGVPNQLYVFSFTTAPKTDETCPKVVETLPANQAQNVGLYPMIWITFSEKIDFNKDLELDQRLAITDDRGNNIDAYPDGISGEGLNIDLKEKLLPNTTYTVQLLKVVKDESGNVNEPYTFSFTTGTGEDAEKVISTDPKDGDINVPVNIAKIKVEFSKYPEDLDVTLSSEKTNDEAISSYYFREHASENYFYIELDSQLQSSTRYTLNLYYNHESHPKYTFSFTTGSTN